jgi:hypothetical protein
MASEYLNNKAFEGIISKFQDVKRERQRIEMIIEDSKDRERRRGRSDPRLAARIEHHQDVMVRFHDAQANLATAFYILSENIVRYAKFNLIDSDDAIQEGVLICFEKIDRFDPSKGKAFNYMTTCILNHFRQLYRTARNYNELKRKYHDFLRDTMDAIALGGTHGKVSSRWQSSKLQG